jgi:hypothetical protein
MCDASDMTRTTDSRAVTRSLIRYKEQGIDGTTTTSQQYW